MKSSAYKPDQRKHGKWKQDNHSVYEHKWRLVSLIRNRTEHCITMRRRRSISVRHDQVFNFFGRLQASNMRYLLGEQPPKKASKWTWQPEAQYGPDMHDSDWLKPIVWIPKLGIPLYVYPPTIRKSYVMMDGLLNKNGDQVRKAQEPKVWTSLTDGTTGSRENDPSTIWNDSEFFAVRIEHSSVEAIKLLPRGGFCEVWLGRYMNGNLAVKRLLPETRNQSDISSFASEIKIMARLDHLKIVRFLGVSWMNTLSIQAVVEFMDSDDLKGLLNSNQSRNLTWSNVKCQIAIDIADALMYLHTLNPKLIHRDIKSRNVLIDSVMAAKLSDFGISRDHSMSETMTAAVGTCLWMAPEVIISGHYTESADIYSFGVILSELDTCMTPFHDAANGNGGQDV